MFEVRKGFFLEGCEVLFRGSKEEADTFLEKLTKNMGPLEKLGYFVEPAQKEGRPEFDCGGEA